MREQQRPVDLLNMDTTVLNGFDAVGDLQDFLNRGLRIGPQGRLDVFIHFIAAAGDVGSSSGESAGRSVLADASSDSCLGIFRPIQSAL